MIISRSSQNIYIKELPFKALFNKDEMKVSLSGYVINCYDYTKNSEQDFENGSSYFQVSGEFDVSFGDWLYLDARYSTKESSIKKISKIQRQNFPNNDFEIPILIWKGPEASGDDGLQILSENVFIQDYESCRRVGLKFYKKEINGDAETVEFSPGFLICPQDNYSEYFPSFNVNIKTGEDLSYKIEVNVSATPSEVEEENGAEILYIKNFTVSNSQLVIDSGQENDEIRFTPEGTNLIGKYYINTPTNGGVSLVFFNVLEKPQVLIIPLFETQVRSAKFYKNGVSTSRFSSEYLIGDEGFYTEIEETRVYNKFTVSEETGEVTPTGEHLVVITVSVENPQDSISELAPVITTSIDEPELEDNEIIVGPVEIEVRPIGEEISTKAYNACRSFARNIEWTPLSLWSGDQTVVLQGAGREGNDEKLEPRVTHAERRFKKIGAPNNDFEITEFLPEKFKHHSNIVYSDGSYEDVSDDINLDKNDFIYKDESWKEIDLKSDGIFGIELIKSEDDLATGEFLNRDITPLVYEAYKKLEISSTESVVV